MVLDDFHRLSTGPASESVAWFVENMPRSFQLVIATRTEPALHLPALRARGDLLELRADDLRFSIEEAGRRRRPGARARPHLTRSLWRRPVHLGENGAGRRSFTRLWASFSGDG